MYKRQILSCLLGMGASLLGFWMSTVRMLYSMANKNFLPKVFAKVNKNQQPMLPNIFLLALSLIFIVLQNSSDFMSAFFNPVSYTHLDVYKRQLELSGTCGMLLVSNKVSDNRARVL